jgi:hypothetical protein
LHVGVASGALDDADEFASTNGFPLTRPSPRNREAGLSAIKQTLGEYGHFDRRTDIVGPERRNLSKCAENNVKWAHSLGYSPLVRTERTVESTIKRLIALSGASSLILQVRRRTQNPEIPARHFEHGNPRLSTSRTLRVEAAWLREASRLWPSRWPRSKRPASGILSSHSS